MSIRELIREYVLAELKLDRKFLALVDAMHGRGLRYSRYPSPFGQGSAHRGDSLRGMGARIGSWWIQQIESQYGDDFFDDVERLKIRNRAISSFTYYMRQLGSHERAFAKVVDDILPHAFLLPRIQLGTEMERHEDDETFKEK